jgi:hypothetical protein
VLEKKFAEIFGEFGICLARMLPRLERAVSFTIRQTWNSPKARAPKPRYDQAPLWTANSGKHGKVSLRAMSANSKNTGEKRASSKSAEESRRYLIRVMRTGAGDISPDDNLCQSRKQITDNVRHGLIKRIVSAVGEGSIAIELAHQYLDRS